MIRVYNFFYNCWFRLAICGFILVFAWFVIERLRELESVKFGWQIVFFLILYFFFFLNSEVRS